MEPYTYIIYLKCSNDNEEENLLNKFFILPYNTVYSLLIILIVKN